MGNSTKQYLIYVIYFLCTIYSLLDIVTASTQDSYVKLIVSSLFYGKEGNARAVLTKALCSTSEVKHILYPQVLKHSKLVIMF